MTLKYLHHRLSTWGAYGHDLKGKSACILIGLLAEGQFVRQHGHCGFGIGEAIRVTAGGLKQWLTSLVNSLIGE
ncbi:hypothetical protein ES705_23478 [subsurface metagenome]